MQPRVKKCEGFPIGISTSSSPQMGACCGRIVRSSTLFRRASVIALLAVLISPLQEFRNYLAEAASCKSLVTECEVRDALKQVGLNKSSGLDGQSYEAYLRLPHMFVTILTDMFNHWFTLGAIPGSVTKGVITLLKKGGRHIWEGLDYYRPMTLQNTELNILAMILANRLQLIISDLNGPEQSYAMKGKSIQDNLHLLAMS